MKTFKRKAVGQKALFGITSSRVALNADQCVPCSKECCGCSFDMSLVMRKPVFRISDQISHKTSSTFTEGGQRLEISDLGSRGIDYLCRENKGADQLRSYCAVDLRLCFPIYAKSLFSHDAYFRIIFLKIYQKLSFNFHQIHTLCVQRANEN